MSRDELVEQVQNLHTLLTATERLIPGNVTPELLTFLEQVQSQPLTAELLLSAFHLLKEKDAKTVTRKVG